MKSPGDSLCLFLCLFVSLALLCTGCENDKQEEKGEGGEESTYVSVEHLLDGQEEALKKEYDNIHLASDISIPAPEEVSLLEYRLSPDICTKEHFTTLCKAFFDTWKEKKMKFVDRDNHDGCGVHWEYSDKGGDYAFLGEYGGVHLSRGQDFDYGGNKVKIFHVDQGEGAEDIYELDGQSISVLDAARFVEEWCGENFSEIEDDQYEYRVGTAYLCEKKNGSYYYGFEVCRWYQGIPLNVFEMEPVGEMKDRYLAHYLMAYMERPDQIASFGNLGSGGDERSFEITAHPCEGDSLIGLQQALQILDQKIAVNQKMNVEQAGLVYLLPLGGSVMIPAWRFAVDEEKYYQDGFRIQDNRDYHSWRRREILIDIQSGAQLFNGKNYQ